MRGYYSSGGGLSGRFTPVVKNLLIANIAMFILIRILLNQLNPLQMDAFLRFFMLRPAASSFIPLIWQFFTYQYLHISGFHLFINMFALWMFGGMVESVWGGRKFFRYYTLCGIGGGFCTWLLTPNYTLGASGAIFGVLLAYGMLFPDSLVYLWFLIPIKAKHFVMLYAAVELMVGLSATPDGVAHFAHLGGMLFGYLYIKRKLPGLPSRLGIQMPKKPTIRVVRSPRPSRGPRSTRIDEILDKITEHGIDALTAEEKRILEEDPDEE